MRFPSLKNLSVDTISDNYRLDVDSDLDLDEALALFLIAHPSFFSVSLGFDPHDECGESSYEDLVRSDMLPRPKGFHGSSICMLIFVHRGFHFLRRLTKLSTGFGNTLLGVCRMNILVKVKVLWGLPALKRLHFVPEAGDREDDGFWSSWMKDFRSICPNLEYLSGETVSIVFRELVSKTPINIGIMLS